MSRNSRSLAEVTAAPPAAAPATQATAIEQSRAVAEVQAAVVVAQQRPRNVQAALDELEQSCRQRELADRAFFAYSRAGSSVTGPTIHLARELARVWGNIQYGIAELSRDDTRGMSEMIAWAWDLQTNTRSSNTFLVPHARDTKSGRKSLVDLRDVYENNANQGARRVREAVFAVLPPWIVERAKSLCHQTLTDGGGVPLQQRIADARRKFEERWGVRLDQLEARIGRPSSRWTEHDAASLRVLWTSLERGETTVDEQFPPKRVSEAEVLASSPAPADQVVDHQGDGEDWPETAAPGGEA